MPPDATWWRHSSNKAGEIMQRWVKLPDGRFIDANSIVFVGKVESFNRYDEDGNDLGLAYAVNLGTGFPREHQINVVGSKDEIAVLLRSVLGANSSAAPAPAT
jgi:hypothetical protein